MIKDLKDSEAKLLALLDDPIINENAGLAEPTVEEVIGVIIFLLVEFI